MSDAGQHILVVDDEPQIVRALTVILRAEGYQVSFPVIERPCFVRCVEARAPKFAHCCLLQLDPTMFGRTLRPSP